MTMNTVIRSVKRPSKSIPVVFVLHEDGAVRASLDSVIRAAGWQPLMFADVATLLSQLHATGPACLILDLEAADVDGLELQPLLAGRPDIPAIFIADNPSVRTTVRAMKAGAVEVLAGPVDEYLLRDAILQALKRSAAVRAHDAEQLALRRRHELLSRREQEVMRHVVRGAPNKNIAADLGITEVTVKAHRGQVMRKMQARTLPDLVNMAAALRTLATIAPGDHEVRPAAFRLVEALHTHAKEVSTTL